MKFGSGSVAPDGCLYVWKPSIYGYVNKPKIIPQIRTLKTLQEIQLISKDSYSLAKKS